MILTIVMDARTFSQRRAVGHQILMCQRHATDSLNNGVAHVTKQVLRTVVRDAT